MLILREVLFATDYSPCADRAFAHAAFLAARRGARLRLVHVAAPDAAPQAPVRPYPVPDGLEVARETLQSEDPATAIAEAARTADLVVMGTHGRRGLRRLALGSTAEGVLRAADCPVLVVGADASHTDPADVARVLVPVDFSASSGVALAVADALAALYGARVDALHAAFVPDLPDVYELGLQSMASYPEIVARTEEALASLLAESVAEGRRGEAAVEIGSPGPTIVDAAEQDEAGLLVLPTHGRTGFERLMFGSVAEHVMRRAPCPVLAIPSFGRVPLAEGARTEDAPAFPDALPPLGA